MATNDRLSHQPVKPEQRRAPKRPAPFFAYPTGKAVPLQAAELFKGKTFYVRCDFPDLYLAQFITDIETLGGSTDVPDAWTADYVINNPPENDNQWQNEFRRRLKAQPRVQPPIQRPYYWVYACHHAGKILSDDAISEHPVFTKWDHATRRPRPLLVYITVNLPAHGDEQGTEPLRAMESTLETLGGFRSSTRMHADVLLLNLDTTAGQKIRDAAKPDQVIWSREDFEAYAERGTPLDMGRDQQPREIVVARTNARSASVATTGKRTSRKEFTAEDDDLVLRYIAAYDPEKKSMTSKSFYTQMMNSSNANVAPWVHRHTAESWRERVKKRVVPFRLRVDAYLHEKVDRTLRTQEERETNSGPAALKAEVGRGSHATSDRASNATAKVAPAKPAVPAEAARGKPVKTTAPSDRKNGKRDLESEETSLTKDPTESAPKKRKTARRGEMPVDARLRDSPPNNMEAGPLRLNGDGSARTRLKPRKSAESDVFDELQNQGPAGRSPAANATKQASKENPITTTKPVTEAKPYLAPASSQPDEDIVRDKSRAALERAMDEAIDEESAAEGQPDTDDEELEQDLLQHIARQERRADQTSRLANDYPQFASQASRRTISPPNVSQVPDTQVPDIGQSQRPGGSPARPRNQDAEVPMAMTGRVLLDSVQVPDLPVRVYESSTRMQSSTISIAGASGQVSTTRTVSEVILQTPTLSEGSANKAQAAMVEASKQPEPSDQERASSRVQTEQEKREELKRIVVGLVQEYDLNYKAMHRLIEECRKRYNYVNQALLRGMIEQALANAEE